MLNESFIPTESLKTQMAGVVLFSAMHSSDNPAETLKEGISRRDFDEDALRVLIDLLPPKVYRPGVIMEIIDAFVAARDSPYNPPRSLLIMLNELHLRFGPDIERFVESSDLRNILKDVFS